MRPWFRGEGMGWKSKEQFFVDGVVIEAPKDDPEPKPKPFWQRGRRYG